MTFWFEWILTMTRQGLDLVLCMNSLTLEIQIETLVNRKELGSTFL